jgi:DNA topoisomerase IB
MPETNATTPRWRDAALAFGEQNASKLFEGRKGHGNSVPTERHLSRNELTVILAAAFERGAEYAASVPASRSRTLHDLGLNWLSAAPVVYDTVLAQALPEFVGENARTSDMQELERHLEHVAVRAAAIAAYIRTRVGTDGTGEKDHADAVKAFNKAQTKVRKALGYTYPKQDIAF